MGLNPPLTITDFVESIMSTRIYPNKTCLTCGGRLPRSTYTYCSRKCYRRPPQDQIKDWLLGGSGVQRDGVLLSAIRNYILEKHNYQCEICKWGEVNHNTGKIPVQIHHKDGNSRNNREENLQVLCPNCHSLTPSFGGANRGNGRTNRYAGTSN